MHWLDFFNIKPPCNLAEECRMEAQESTWSTVTRCRHETHTAKPPVIVTVGYCIPPHLNYALTGCFVVFSQLIKQINQHCSCSSTPRHVKQKGHMSNYVIIQRFAHPERISAWNKHITLNQFRNDNKSMVINCMMLRAIWFVKYL
jgi:hypothetical protein